VVIFAGGTGNPYMTADTAAALRAIEIGAEVLLMTKNGVDGIYTADPRKDPKAKKIDRITHLQVLNRRLEVMDTTALTLCLDNKLPIIVFDLEAKDGMQQAVLGKAIGTLVSSEK
jgi:uridylate kinase